MDKQSTLNIKSKQVIRPNKFINVNPTAYYDMSVTITNCLFNGKCYEILAQTKNQNLVDSGGSCSDRRHYCSHILL